MIKESLLTVVAELKKSWGTSILDVSHYAGDTLVLVSSEKVHEILAELHTRHNFTYLADIFGTDRFTEDERFEVIYNLFSLRDVHRIFIKTRVTEDNPVVKTASDIWPAANWNEREVYDMFGITFAGHPDPRRIFMPEDFEYFPLRKEFPLIGVPGSLELPNTNPDAE